MVKPRITLNQSFFITMDKRNTAKYRNLARVRLETQGRYHHLEQADWYLCEILDISAGGINLIGASSFLVGDKLGVEFFLRKELIYCQLEILNIGGKRGGGQFIMLHKDSEDAIREYIHAEFSKG